MIKPSVFFTKNLANFKSTRNPKHQTQQKLHGTWKMLKYHRKFNFESTRKMLLCLKYINHLSKLLKFFPILTEIQIEYIFIQLTSIFSKADLKKYSEPAKFRLNFPE